MLSKYQDIIFEATGDFILMKASTFVSILLWWQRGQVEKKTLNLAGATLCMNHNAQHTPLIYFVLFEFL